MNGSNKPWKKSEDENFYYIVIDGSLVKLISESNCQCWPDSYEEDQYPLGAIATEVYYDNE